MRSLYEKAKRDQWNATRDIAWATPEPDRRPRPRRRADRHPRQPPLGASLGERDRVELNRRITAWRLSVLVYGEQGAMLACSQLVDIVPGTDEKFFQATQVMDEARHNEVLERYIQTRLGGLHYPMPENERVLFDAILTDSRWYIKTIALQLVAETFAVVDVQDDGRGRRRSRARRGVPAASCRTSRATWASACSPCPRSSGRRATAEREEMEDFTCLARGEGAHRASSRSRPTGHRLLAPPRSHEVQRLPARRGGPERLRGVPEVLPARHARLDGEQPRAHRAAHRARAAAPRRPRRRPARRGLARRGAHCFVGASAHATQRSRAAAARARSGPGRRGLASLSGPPKQLAQTAVAVVEERRTRAPAPSRARACPAGRAAADRSRGPPPTCRPLALAAPSDEAVAVLPAREGPAELHVHEAIRARRTRAPSRASGSGQPSTRTRKSSTAPAASPAGGAASHRRCAPGGLDEREIPRVGEELEDLRPRARQPEAPLEDIVSHAAAAGGASAPRPPSFPRAVRRPPESPRRARRPRPRAALLTARRTLRGGIRHAARRLSPPRPEIEATGLERRVGEPEEARRRHDARRSPTAREIARGYRASRTA